MLAKAFVALIVTLVISAILHEHMPVEMVAILDFIMLAILFAPRADETMFDRHYARYLAWKANRPPRVGRDVPTEPWHAKARRMFKRKPKLVEAPRQASPRRSTQSRRPPDWVDPYLDPPEIKVREKTSDKQKAA